MNAADRPPGSDAALGSPTGEASDADFRLMVDSISDYAIFLLDPTGHIRTWNRGAQRFKGYTPTEAIGQHIRIFYPPDLQAEGWPEHELEEASREGRFEDEGWRVRKDGTQFWANVVLTRLVDANGKLRGFSKITRDLSERRQQEERLRSSEERFRLLVERVQDYAIFLLDTEGRVASWNAGAIRNKGYSAEEIMGRHFSVFYPAELVEAGWPQEELRRALEDGRVEDEGWRLRKDGSRFWANVVITALFDEHGEHRGFAKVTRDLSDKRRISNLEDEGKRITTFLAMLGHELRNPLAPIANSLAIMGLPDAQAEHLHLARGVISRQVAQLTRLVDDLLDVSRITSGKIHMDRKPCALADVIADAMEAAAPLAQGKRLRLAATPVDASLWASVDRARMIQVVGNLLTNSIKFTPAEGEVVLSLVRNGDSAEIRVRDSGIGIPALQLSEIFNPFVQVSPDSSRSQGGLGLGLSLVHQIVGMHNGQVAAYSGGHLVRGSEFVVSLPIVPAGAALVGEPMPVEAPAAFSILVVDDNQDAAETTRIVLDSLGYRASVVHDGKAALEAVRQHCPAAMLLDIGLPGISGIEVARQVLLECKPPPRLIAVTGYGGDEDREATAAAGFDAHLTKPVDFQQVATLLRNLLGGAPDTLPPG